MKKIWVLALLFLWFIVGVAGFIVYQNALLHDDLANLQIGQDFEKIKQYNKDLEKLNNTNDMSKDDFDYFVGKFSDSQNKDLLNKVKFKYCQNIFIKTQNLLKNTLELTNTINVKHPIIQNNINKIIENTQVIKTIIDQVKDIKNDENFNFNYYYLKGNIYYLGLLILADEQTKEEFFNQCLDSYKKAANIRMGHSEIVANIEILLQNNNSENTTEKDPVNRILIQAGASHLKGN